jgi:hypothetical protein
MTCSFPLLRERSRRALPGASPDRWAGTHLVPAQYESAGERGSDQVGAEEVVGGKPGDPLPGAGSHAPGSGSGGVGGAGDDRSRGRCRRGDLARGGGRLRGHLRRQLGSAHVAAACLAEALGCVHRTSPVVTAAAGPGRGGHPACGGDRRGNGAAQEGKDEGEGKCASNHGLGSRQGPRSWILPRTPPLRFRERYPTPSQIGSSFLQLEARERVLAGDGGEGYNGPVSLFPRRSPT